MKGKSSINFFSTLERRLDCILYRACFVTSLQGAKQLISHKKICINNNIISKPGYLVEPGDIISVVSGTSKSQAQTITDFLKAEPTQEAIQNVSTRFARRMPSLVDRQQNRTKKLDKISVGCKKFKYPENGNKKIILQTIAS